MEIIIRFIAGAIAFAIGIFIAEFLLHIIRQRRQKKPCFFCDASKLPRYLIFGKDAKTIIRGYINDGTLIVKTETYDMGMQRATGINYCPMCGRKLKQE